MKRILLLVAILVSTFGCFGDVWELGVWTSDGAANSGDLLRRIPGMHYLPHRPVSTGDHVYFIATSDVESKARLRYELWKSTGTRGGTLLVTTIPRQRRKTFRFEPDQATTAGKRFFFVLDSGPRENQLWTSDGTPAGTKQVLQIAGALRELTAVGPLLFFLVKKSGHAELWRSDGNSAGTVRLRTEIAESVHDLVGLGHSLLFLNAGQLWKSDGTAAGTAAVKDLRSSIDHDPFLSPYAELGGALYFPTWLGLWKSDGTEAGTVLIKSLPKAPHNLTAAGGLVFFLVGDSYDTLDLWRSDGTSDGTLPIGDVKPKDSKGIFTSVRLARAGQKLLFNTADEQHGWELWTSDGTSAGTTLFVDFCPGPCSSWPEFVQTGERDLFFETDSISSTGPPRKVIYKADGTNGGTVRLALREVELASYATVAGKILWIQRIFKSDLG